MKLTSSISEIAKETLWPTRCAICDVPGEVFCEDCKSHFKFIDACQACERCGAPYAKNQCTECNDVMISSSGIDAFPLDQMRHAVALDDDSIRLITVFKDAHERRLATEIANIMASYIEPAWLTEGTPITFIPASDSAFAKRGFDHMEEISLEIAKIANVPLLSIFERPRSADQRELGRKERVANMEQIFHLKSHPQVLFKDEFSSQSEWCKKPIIICDDVCTSGSTLYGAALALRDGGWQKIYALTFGKVLD